MSMGEILVLLDPRSAAEALDRVRATFRVVHVASPRLVVVEAETDTAPESVLARTPGVVSAAAGGAVQPLGDHALSAEERLFVDAWVLRLRETVAKQRPGDGLPWDADGFQPA